jgi:hypothetical protein
MIIIIVMAVKSESRRSRRKKYELKNRLSAEKKRAIF